MCNPVLYLSDNIKHFVSTFRVPIFNLWKYVLFHFGFIRLDLQMSLFAFGLSFRLINLEINLIHWSNGINQKLVACCHRGHRVPNIHKNSKTNGLKKIIWVFFPNGRECENYQELTLPMILKSLMRGQTFFLKIFF